MPAQRVLIVEDDEPIREVMRIILEDAGYVVDAAAEGVAALAQLRASSDHMIVVTDLLMPGMGGEALLRTAVADADLATRHAYLMVAAKSSLPPAVVELLEQLHASYVHKPFNIDELLAAVAEARARLAR
ncbi:MAG TPA: response regulator [Ktedonobacterales bacterium]